MYGPFSAAYPGNSVGAVVDYVTRMPTKLEAHVKAGYSSQPNDLYNTHQTFNSWQTSASLGSRSGDWSWWIDLNRTDSHGQPLTFTTATVASGAPSRSGTPVAGFVPGLNTTNTPWYILGSGTAYHTVQDHAKLKLAYDFSPTVRATYTLGWWQNSGEGRPDSYLRNASGQPVYSGPVNIGGRSYTLAPTAFPLTDDQQTHYMHGLSVKSNTKSEWDWEVAASLYDYSKDLQRAPTVALPLAAIGGAGTLQDQGGTGWNTLAAKGTWRPQGVGGAHIVDFGVGRDAYKLKIVKTNVVGSWLDGAPFSPVSHVGGRTETFSAWVQDTLVLRAEMEGGARPALRGLEGDGRLDLHGDQFPVLCRARRIGCFAQGCTGVSTGRGHRAQGVARPGRALSHRRRAVRRNLGRRAVLRQRPEPQAREIVDRRALGREGPGQRPGARHPVPRDHARRALQPARSRAPRSRACRTSTRCAPPAWSSPTPGRTS